MREPEKRAFQLLPGLFGGTVAVVLALVLLKATATQDWPAWMRAVVVLGVGLSVAGVVQAFLVPRLREKVQRLGHVGEVRSSARSSGAENIRKLLSSWCLSANSLQGCCCPGCLVMARHADFLSGRIFLKTSAREWTA